MIEHETTIISNNGQQVRCMAKIIGNDLFRYFVNHYEFPFCSVCRPNELNQFVGITYGSRFIFNEDFTHEQVLQWAIGAIKEKDFSYYQMLFEQNKEK